MLILPPAFDNGQKNVLLRKYKQVGVHSAFAHSLQAQALPSWRNSPQHAAFHQHAPAQLLAMPLAEAGSSLLSLLCLLHGL